MLASDPSQPPYSGVLSQLRAASLNCYVYEAEAGLGQGGLEERASLLQQQLPLSDPCTFRILHKNALTLVTDPAVEREAGASLEALVRWGGAWGCRTLGGEGLSHGEGGGREEVGEGAW